MSRKRRRSSRIRRRYMRIGIFALGVVLIIAGGMFAASRMDTFLSLPVENAGQQMTAYRAQRDAAHYFVDGQWVYEKDTETLLVIGIDDFGSITSSESYNNGHQADFMALFIRDNETGESSVIHLNRDTMTEVSVLGVTGQKAGSRTAQLALAYTYGKGKEDSCKNTVEAVENLLYGIEIDHYFTITMDAVAIMNDWAGGVTLEVLDDFSGVDETLVLGEETTLYGQQALRYIRMRKGLEDSSNINRMKRQRQYAEAWMEKAGPLMQDTEKAMDLILQLSDHHYSDCTANELSQMMEWLSDNPPETAYEIEGSSVRGDVYMEYYADDDKVHELVVDLFFEPVE